MATSPTLRTLKRALARRRRAGCEPGSLYALATAWGIPRSMLSDVLSGKRASRPLVARVRRWLARQPEGGSPC